MKTNKFLFFGSSICFLLFSCKKVNHSPEISYQLKTSTSSSTVTGRVMAGNVQWISGYASIVEIEFEAKNHNVDVEYKSEAKKKVDLFSTLSTLGVVSVPSGTYEETKFEVEVQPSGTDAAFQLSGNFTNSNGITTPVVFKLNSILEIESKQPNVTVTDGNNLTALTTLNLSLVTTGVSETMFNNATRTNGVIEISATSNPNIYQMLYDNLRNCGGVEVE